MVQNRKVTLKEYAVEWPTQDNFAVEEEALGDPVEGHLIVKNHTLSVDAWIRTTLSDAGMHTTSALGDTIRAFGVGQVVASGDPDWAVGDWAYGMLCAQSHAVVPAAEMSKVEVGNQIGPEAHVGPLGITTGLTAWVGLCAVGEAAKGEVVVVSGAAGAVGSCVVQIAKARGCHVIGIAGGPEKCAYLTDQVGADVAIDYKANDKDGGVRAALAKAAPDGVDVFFDNVGGDILDDVLDNLRPTGGARVVICGAISQYEDLDNVQGPSLYLRLAERNASMRGFVVSYHAARFPEARAEISDLIRSGDLQLEEHVVEGIDNFPEALMMLFSGGHRGNLVVRA